jgi:DNA-binding HxlR family transcriptional regulator
MNGRPDPRNAGARGPRPGRAAGSSAGTARPDAGVAWSDAAAVLDLLAGKWVLPVLQVLDEGGPQRHNQLRRAIPAGVSAKSLDDTLRRMEAAGLVERSVHPGNPPSVSYQLTPLASSLLDPLACLGCWGSAHLRKPRPAGRRTGSRPAA